MEQEFYVILFRAGSSGRFIGNLIWGSLFPNKYSLTVSEYNSSHNQSPWGTTVKINQNPRTAWFYGDRKFYDKIEFTSTPAMICVHSQLNFDDFFTKLPFSKIVFISLNNVDLREVYINCILKNGFENFNIDGVYKTDKVYVHNRYKKIYGINPIGNFDNDFIKNTAESYADIMLEHSYRRDNYFLNPSIPNEYSKNILVLNYSDIVFDKNKILNNISTFINKHIPDNVSNFYDTYLDGRKQLLEKYML